MDKVKAQKMKKHLSLFILLLFLAIIGLLIILYLNSRGNRVTEETLKVTEVKEFEGDRPEFEQIFNEWKNTDFSNWNIVEDKELGIRVKVPPEYRRTMKEIYDEVPEDFPEATNYLLLNNKTDEEIKEINQEAKRFIEKNTATEIPPYFGESEISISKNKAADLNKELINNEIPCIKNSNFTIKNEFDLKTGNFKNKDKRFCYYFNYQLAGNQEIYLVEEDSIITFFSYFISDSEDERIKNLKTLMFIALSYENI